MIKKEFKDGKIHEPFKNFTDLWKPSSWRPLSEWVQLQSQALN